MGYEVFVTRADSAYESDSAPISLQEWLGFAEGNPRLVEAGWVDWADVGRVPVFGYSCAAGIAVSLTWSDGAVAIKGLPNADAARELVDVAVALGANLVGEEGERYTRST